MLSTPSIMHTRYVLNHIQAKYGRVIKAGFRDHSGQLTKGSGKYIIF